MPNLRFRQSLVAVLLALGMLCQGTLVLAGTTGTLTGTLTDASGAAVSGATVTAASPSQNSTATTDKSGHYTFLGLAPDTYTVSVQAPGYDSTIVNGVTIQADQSRTLTLVSNKTIQQIGRVTARANSDLVRPGTTADVYSVNAAQQAKVQALGGGGNLNTAWSALTSVPGVFVAPNQSGYIGAGATLSIRGGDYDQVGYEIDGIPVNRAFDNYPSGPASSLGQQELQVYTGGAPANANAQGLSGFINQVIRTGTNPGFGNIEFGVGSPTFYNKLSFEVGGATPNKLFSYYIGVDGYNQNFRIADQYNGASLGLYGTPLVACAPGADPSCYVNGQYAGNNGTGGFVLGSYNTFAQSSVETRDNVVNLHFGIPHKDGTKDDFQVLGVVNQIKTSYYDSTNDQGGAAYLAANGTGVPFYIDGYAYNGPLGVALPNNAQALSSQYFFPSVPNHAFQANIDPTYRDAFSNSQAIYKLEWTHPIGANALLKIYGYTYYSNWFNTGPQTAYSNFIGSVTPEYELSAHTRGVALNFTDQLDSHNLLTLDADSTTSTTVRVNNTQWLNGLYGPNTINARTVIGALVDSTNPTNGLCYTPAGTATTCAESKAGGAQFVTLQQAYNGTIAPIPASCGGNACEYLTVGNGNYGTFNAVKPIFSAVSLTDTFKPTDKLSIDAGIRYDRFQYNNPDTSSTARSFFFNSFNLDNCFNTTTLTYSDKITKLGLPSVNSPCPAGYISQPLINPTGTVIQGYNEWQPRFGVTYSVDPRTVVRASYGRYAQAPNSAFEQYNALQANLPALITAGFQKFGFFSPDHAIVPPTSNNLDLSVEHQFPGQLSVKLSPFYRVTQNQIQQFYLDQKTNFVSGLNVGNQTSKGVELEVDKGNFSQNGFSAKLSLAYTYSTIKYQPFSNGSNIIAPFNVGIQAYNAYTSACAAVPGKTMPNYCGTTANGVGAAPCYTTGGAADPACAAGSIANPYWNAPPQPLMDPNGQYPTFDLFPAGIGTAVAAYGAPYTAVLVAQYKHDKIAITPAVQMFAGQRYGAPASTLGIAPDTCGAAYAATTAGDPRYPYGAPGGSAYEYSSCGTLTNGIPDPYTGKFDTIGAFSAPTQLQFHLQATYDISKHVQIVANFTNIVNTCFGGTKTGFTVKGACNYGVVGGGTTGDVGNTYNPNAPVQPYVNTPYEPAFAGTPFGMFLTAKFKI